MLLLGTLRRRKRNRGNNIISTWMQLGLDINGEDPADYSGYSVSMNAAGDRVAIGAYRIDGGRGRVRVYNLT
jgi:hypothetical protein